MKAKTFLRLVLVLPISPKHLDKWKMRRILGISSMTNTSKKIEELSTGRESCQYLLHNTIKFLISLLLSLYS